MSISRDRAAQIARQTMQILQAGEYYVPVIRTDDGELLETPWMCSFLTAPAPNSKVVLERAPARVFGNAPREVAELFHEALAGPFQGAFERIAFAITDTSPEKRTLGPFLDVFGR